MTLGDCTDVTEVCRADLYVQVSFGTGVKNAVVTHNPLQSEHPGQWEGTQQGLDHAVAQWWTAVTTGFICPF